MKKLIACLMIAASVVASAQSEIRFRLLPVEAPDLNEAACATIDTKLHQALARTQAETENPANVFAVRPSVDVSEAMESSGLVQEVGSVTGELTLQAVNTVDGVVFHSVTIPLAGASTGGKQAAMKALANSLKATNPAFVRFIRKARERIVDYYGDTIIVEQIVVAPTEPQVIVVESEPDTVYVDRVVEVPVAAPVQEVPVAAPVQEAPKPAPVAPKPEAPQCRIKLSHPDELSVKVISCVGNPVGDQVKILCEITNKQMKYTQQGLYFTQAFDDNGNEFNRNDLLTRGSYSKGINFPEEVPVKVEFTVNKVKPTVPSFSYLNIEVGPYKVQIYNLPISWK